MAWRVGGARRAAMKVYSWPYLARPWGRQAGAVVPNFLSYSGLAAQWNLLESLEHTDLT